MKHVQIAIQDRAYAEELRNLLAADGTRTIHILEHPTPAIDGVVVLDEGIAQQLPLSERHVVFVRHVEFQADELFRAGVRYVIHSDCSPYLGFLIILAAERGLNEDPIPMGLAQSDVVAHRMKPQPSTEGASVFDSSDRLFLQALKISHL